MEEYKWDKELDELLKDMGIDGSPIEVIQEKLQQEFDRKLNIGFIGSPGVGKSTLMNKIAGQKITDAGVNPGVKVTKFAWGENNSIIFWDLPGYNGIPDGHGIDNYWEEYDICELDVIVCMFSNKLNEHDVNFFKLAIQHSQDVIFVRSKADDLYDPELSIEELKQQTEKTYIKDIFGEHQSLLFISAKDPDSLAQLQDEISNRLNNELQEKFRRNAKSYSEAFLEAKEKASLKTVLLFSVLGAGAGAIPVAGILIDIPANIKMIQSIGHNFNLSPNRLKLIEEIETQKMKEINIYLNLLKQGMNAKDLYIPLLQKFAPRIVGANFAKYIPIAGAGAGFSLTFFMGMQAIANCREIAEKVMEKEIYSSSFN
jgi:small GTP-binding protein